MKKKSKMMAMVSLMALLLAANIVQAQTNVNWATGGAFKDKIGNNGLFGPEYLWNEVQTDCDKVTLAGASGSLNLVLGVPQIVVINPLTFQIGQTGAQPDESYTLTTDFSMARNITINGVTKSLFNPMTHVVTWNWDSLQVRAGAPVVFGDIIITPLGWVTAFQEGPGVFDQTSPSWSTISPVYAEFRLSEVSIPITIETVPVGNAGNTADTTGFGAVANTYNIGKYEVTAGQYTAFLNAVAKTDTYGLYNEYMGNQVDTLGMYCNIQRSGASGSYTYSVASEYANRPVNYVSFWDACRFVNWLHNGQGNGDTETGAYTLTAGGIAGNTILRNEAWKWAVASRDEWYKAAYYNSVASSYYLYPTSSDTVPGYNMSDPLPGNNANYYDWVDENNYSPSPIDSNIYYTTVGGEFQNSASPYGTFDQCGSVWEWNDTITEDEFGSYRIARGGSFLSDKTQLPASFQGATFGGPMYEDGDVGFRVVGLPSDAITLASFMATPKTGQVILKWVTESEIDNAGFNIYRAETENGAYVKINDLIISAKGAATEGASYDFSDKHVKLWKTFYYKLEDIDLNGTATMHGPVSATPRLLSGFGK